MENLDFHFLRYIGVTREGQRGIHAFYLPFFQGRRRVVDLGCGEGYFVEMLAEMGVEALGVDRDSRCCQAASEQGIKVVCQDVFEYLRELGEGELDGVFAAHLAEHLTYQENLDLLALCHRALAPGGAIVLATPNPRSLFSHLEMFYMHFGHVSFYHPNLLCFFLQQSGFSNSVSGENPNLTSLLLGNYRLEEADPVGGGEGAKGPRGWLRSARHRLGRAIAGPYLEGLASRSNRNFQRINGMLDVLDRSFECYVKAVR